MNQHLWHHFRPFPLDWPSKIFNQMESRQWAKDHKWHYEKRRPKHWSQSVHPPPCKQFPPPLGSFHSFVHSLFHYIHPSPIPKMPSSQNILLLLFAIVISVCAAIREQQQFGNLAIGANKDEAVQFAPPPPGRILAKRRIFDLLSFLNKRRDSEFAGAFEALPVQTRSLEHNNCYFSPIQCYLEERKRRSAPREPMAELGI